MYLFFQINSKEQLKNVSQLNIYKYKYKQDFADSVGLPENQRHDTGVLAQEVQTVLPDAVMETGNVALNSGKNVNNLLVVNKVSYIEKLHFLFGLIVSTLRNYFQNSVKFYVCNFNIHILAVANIP